MAGQSMSWTERQKVTLELGNPPGVQLTVNGKRQHTSTPQVLFLNFSPPSS